MSSALRLKGGEQSKALVDVEHTAAPTQYVTKYPLSCESSPCGRFCGAEAELPREDAIPNRVAAGLDCDIDAALLEQTEATDLRSALDAHAIVVVTDPLGRITCANDKFCTISKYSRGELLGANLRLLNSGYHPSAYFRELWETITRGEIWHGEFRNRAKDGSFYWVATTIVPFYDGQGTLCKFVAINSDISVQKRVEAELEERLRLQRLLADLPSRFVAVQSDRIDAAIEDTQHLIVQILGLDISLLWQFADHQANVALTHSYPPCSSAEPLRNLLSDPDFSWSAERVRQGENVCFSSISELPLEAARDAEALRNYSVRSGLMIPLIVNGRICGALALVARSHEHRWREDEIIELELVAQIIGSVIGRQRAERREEQLRAELAHAMRVATLGELAATLAHELNQPLAAILSNAQAARRFVAANAISQEELSAIFDDIVRDDKRAGGIVHNLRAMVSKAPVAREPCCLNQLTREVIDLVHAEALAGSITLHTTLLPDLPKIIGCSVELQQILMNLLINAVHATKEVFAANRIIEVETDADDTFVSVRVRDHGYGIPPERLSQIFAPFFTTKPGGLGMGLSICRRIVEQHGGRIEAASREGGGACFSLWLPIATQTAS